MSEWNGLLKPKRQVDVFNILTPFNTPYTPFRLRPFGGEEQQDDNEDISPVVQWLAKGLQPLLLLSHYINNTIIYIVPPFLQQPPFFKIKTMMVPCITLSITFSTLIMFGPLCIATIVLTSPLWFPLLFLYLLYVLTRRFTSFNSHSNRSEPPLRYSRAQPLHRPLT